MTKKSFDQKKKKKKEEQNGKEKIVAVINKTERRRKKNQRLTHQGPEHLPVDRAVDVSSLGREGRLGLAGDEEVVYLFAPGSGDSSSSISHSAAPG